MKIVGKMILDIFFPNRCPFCDKIIKWDKLACDSCIEEILFTGDEVCSKCGKNPCCCSESNHYDGAFTACYYEGKAREGIIALKKSNATNSAEFFADILSEKIKGSKIKVDYIVPVPMSRKKKRKRGYNQAYEIAEKISEKIELKIISDCILKNENTMQQHELNAEERAEYVKNAFIKGNNKEIKGKNIILCDDVMTTGSTMNYCSSLLKEMGAERVYVAACCITRIYE